MQAAADPFSPLLRVLERYRSDVHHLRPPAGEQAIPAVQQHLGVEIPSSLRAFLARWNGAVLFRGALRVRGVADLANPRPDVNDVVLFADGPRDDDRWGFAAVHDGHHFGRWDGERLVPLHEGFAAWLDATVRVLDEDRLEPAAQLAVRIDTDPQNGLLQLHHGEALLSQGDADGALKAFRRATAMAPELSAAWQRLGESLLSLDRPAGVTALLTALRAARLPVYYPGAPLADSSLIRLLEAHFPPGDPGWERELHHLLTERVADVRHAHGASFYEGAVLAYARAVLRRDDRPSARVVLQSARDRAAGFTRVPDLPELLLALVGLDTDLGHHDEAEDTLRRLRRHPEAAVRARAELALSRIALVREEPWVEEIARGAGPLDAADRCDAQLVIAERALGRGPDEAVPALDEAERLATRLDDAARLARVRLLRGDVARARGDVSAARAHYLGCDADPEARLRAEVRLGDLAADPADALPHYVAAVTGYQQLHLPVREAWARLRLVRCGDATQAEEARALFRDVGLAAGVAAADMLAGRPGQSLAWHLQLAAEHARQRHDAQRMRPPLTRADADRPERRLLAHRRAIAATDARIVQVLADDVLGELSRLQAGDGRPRDPAVMRFVAGVDLLSGHPSYDAAKVMMQLLVADIRQETAARALIGALARSPNMTLVDALLAAARSLTEPRALAAVIEVLGWRREPEAAPRLRELAATGSTPVRRAAIAALGRIGDTEAVDVILTALDVPELADAASLALLLLGDWQGVDFHGQALTQDVTTLSRSPGEIVGRHGGPSYLLLLLRVADREGPVALGAVQGLGLLGSTRAVPKLIELCAHRDPARAHAASAALEVLTGHGEDVEEPQLRARWDVWWQENAGRFDDRVRWRGGAPHTVRSLIERLGHDDVITRLTAYDELVIATGARLPFDADGPWRMQVAHRAAWARWYADHAHELPESGWLFFGEAVG
jgi:tetratricopeptide (TPR) repeat protein